MCVWVDATGNDILTTSIDCSTTSRHNQIRTDLSEAKRCSENLNENYQLT